MFMGLFACGEWQGVSLSAHATSIPAASLTGMVTERGKVLHLPISLLAVASQPNVVIHVYDLACRCNVVTSANKSKHNGPLRSLLGRSYGRSYLHCRTLYER